MKLISFVLVFTLTSFSFDKDLSQIPTGNLEINVSSFRNGKGHLLISLYNTKKDFPVNNKNAFRTKKVKVTNESHMVTFKDLPYGEYALIFLHDENGNEDMDTNLVGMPQEGYGASNNAVNLLSAPKYEEAKFKMNMEKVVQNLKIYY